MTRDDALLRRIAEATDSEESKDSKESSEEQESSAVREGYSGSVEPSVLRERAASDDEGSRAVEAIDHRPIDPAHDGPPDLPEGFEIPATAPDGSAFGRDAGFTSPMGGSIGGSTLASDIEARGSEFGSTRPDPLGTLSRDPADIGGPSDREIEETIAAHDGSQASWGVSVGGVGYDSGGGMYLGVGVGPVEAHVSKDEYDAITSFPERQIDAATQALESDLAKLESAWDTVTGGSGDEERPDPTGGYDVITQSTIDAALKVNNPDVYAQPTQDGESHDVAASVARAAAANNPDQVTNYGPEGEQTVEVGDNWAPPPDTLFDPPPDASAMGDAGAAVGGSMVGSTGETDFPPPPDPPPGGDDGGGGGPMGPPGGDGGEG
jgi:hypothetical protein